MNHHSSSPAMPGVNLAQEVDLKWLAQAGIRLLRLPIGYWALNDQSPYISAKPQLDWLMDMARHYNLRVLLDLHAAPGAQNASDHSGSGNTGNVQWYQRANQQKTTQILLDIANEYGEHPALWGIELLNEPLVTTRRERWQLWWWTRKTSRKLRSKLPSHVRIVASDCYQPAWWSGRVGPNTLDVHHYQCLSDTDNQATSLTHHRQMLDQRSGEYHSYSRQQPLIIGEWSAALPPGIASDSTEYAHCQSQLAVPANVDAWFYWSYKTESSGAWNFRDCHAKGGLTVCLARGRWYNGYMSFPKLIYSIAVLVIIAWVLSNIFRLAAWLINGLLYVAILVVIIGLIAQFISQKKRQK